MEIKTVKIPSWLTDPIETLEVDQPFFTQPGYLNQNDIDLLFDEYVEADVIHNWLNITTYAGTENHFNWHNEKGIGEGKFHPGEYAGILWISGEMDKGGDLQYIDEGGMLHQIPFEPNQLITIKGDTLHRVMSYYSDVPRVALNYTF